MGLMVTVAAAWAALAGIALVAMSVLGRLAREADTQSAAAATTVLEQRAGVHLAVSNERPVTDEDHAVCPTCASLVVGALDGDPCPACGTAVSELPRIRPHVAQAARRARTRRAI